MGVAFWMTEKWQTRMFPSFSDEGLFYLLLIAKEIKRHFLLIDV
jgi:hypothetical protein